MMYQYELYLYMLPPFPVLFKGSRCGLWHPPMAHMPVLAALCVFILPVPRILRTFKGFRCGLWHPPMAHKTVSTLLCALIPGPLLKVLLGPLLSHPQAMFRLIPDRTMTLPQVPLVTRLLPMIVVMQCRPFTENQLSINLSGARSPKNAPLAPLACRCPLRLRPVRLLPPLPPSRRQLQTAQTPRDRGRLGLGMTVMKAVFIMIMAGMLIFVQMSWMIFRGMPILSPILQCPLVPPPAR
jgi:hypothetical protein